jgi:hypothetical protein
MLPNILASMGGPAAGLVGDALEFVAHGATYAGR